MTEGGGRKGNLGSPTMKPSFFRLNVLFPTDETIENVIQYKQTGIVPHAVKKPSSFIKKYHDFVVRNNHLFYAPADLEVIPKSKMNEVLQTMYDDVAISSGAGIVALYKKVCQKYINIRRTDVANFLHTQATYTMTKPITHRINKPILAFKPNQMWCIDLIDMNPYSNANPKSVGRFYRYILTVIDTFSRYIWLDKLVNKEAVDVRDAMKRITARAEVKPTYILSDNGTEFEGEFKAWCEDNGIKQRKTATYSPQANGIVERANQEIRKVCRDIFTRTGVNNWCNYLEDIEKNRNSAFHSRLKTAPNEVWANEPDVELTKSQLEAHENVRQKAKQSLQKFKSQNFEEGDCVRVRMTALYSNIRKIVKQGNKKLIPITYSPELYTVAQVIKPSNSLFERPKYTLKTKDGVFLTKRLLEGVSRKPLRFYASDLVKTLRNSASTMTNEDALRLDRAVEVGNDVEPSQQFIPLLDEEPITRKSTTRKPPVPIVPIVRAQRERRPNYAFKDFYL